MVAAGIHDPAFEGDPKPFVPYYVKYRGEVFNHFLEVLMVLSIWYVFDHFANFFEHIATRNAMTIFGSVFPRVMCNAAKFSLIVLLHQLFKILPECIKFQLYFFSPIRFNNDCALASIHWHQKYDRLSGLRHLKWTKNQLSYKLRKFGWIQRFYTFVYSIFLFSFAAYSALFIKLLLDDETINPVLKSLFIAIAIPLVSVIFSNQNQIKNRKFFFRIRK